jgi:hypothetical protein
MPDGQTENKIRRKIFLKQKALTMLHGGSMAIRLMIR